MAKYAANSNNSEAAANESQEDNTDSVKLNQSCRAECNSQLCSEGIDDEFCVDSSRPYFQDSDTNDKNLAA